MQWLRQFSACRLCRRLDDAPRRLHREKYFPDFQGSGGGDNSVDDGREMDGCLGAGTGQTHPVRSFSPPLLSLSLSPPRSPSPRRPLLPLVTVMSYEARQEAPEWRQTRRDGGARGDTEEEEGGAVRHRRRRRRHHLHQPLSATKQKRGDDGAHDRLVVYHA